jgi:hypothetical protein
MPHAARADTHIDMYSSVAYNIRSTHGKMALRLSLFLPPGSDQIGPSSRSFVRTIDRPEAVCNRTRVDGLFGRPSFGVGALSASRTACKSIQYVEGTYSHGLPTSHEENRDAAVNYHTNSASQVWCER